MPRLVRCTNNELVRRTRWQLALALAAHPDDIEAALAGIETAMFARSQAEAAGAHEVQGLCLGDRVPYGLIELLGGDSRASH